MWNQGLGSHIDKNCAETPESAAKNIPNTQHFYLVNLPDWPKYLGFAGKNPLPGVRSPWR